MSEEMDVKEVVRTTAANMYNLLMQLADHIEVLEKQIEELEAGNENEESN